MKLLTLTALFLLSTGAMAEFRITMGGGVYHWIGDRDDLNEANYFWGASYGPVYGATFVNSFGDRSNTGGIVLRSDSSQWLEGSLFVGGVTGYGDPDYMSCNAGLCAYIAPSVSVWVRDDVALTGLMFGDALLYGLSVRW